MRMSKDKHSPTEAAPAADAAEQARHAPAEPASIVVVKKSALQLKVDAATEKISKALDDCAISVIRNLEPMQQLVQMAAGMRSLRTAMTDDIVEELFVPLRGSKLGFRTDRDNGNNGPPYGVSVIRDVAIEALVHGALLVGNEVNIISGAAYFTREFYTRKVMEWPGISDVRSSPGLPTINGDGTGAAVPFEVTWKLNNREDKLSCTLTKDSDGKTMSDRRIAVKLNKGQGTDAAIGKARRKAMYMVYERLQGNRFMPEDGDALDTTGTAVGEFTSTKTETVSAGAQPASGTAQGMDALLSRIKGSSDAAGATGAPAAPAKTDAEILAAEVAENERQEREALEKENAK